MNEPVRIIIGDVRDELRKLLDGSVHCCVTSPPYWGLRDYGVDGQIGLEPTPDAFVGKMVEVFREVRRVLREDGTLWLNIGDSYAANRPYQVPDSKHRDVGNHVSSKVPDGLKPKDLCMIPWRVALALQADGWWIRSVIVWAKKSPMPESVTDRPTSSWEPIFLMAKNERYYYDAEAVKEPLERGDAGSSFTSDRKLASHPGTGQNRMPPIGGIKHAGNNGNATYSGDCPEWPDGRNQRNVWHLGPEPYAEAHFATFPTEIPRRAIKAGCPKDGVVLDPFLGSGTTLAVARQLGRRGIGIELNPEYAELARIRIGKAERPSTFVDPRVKDSPLFTQEGP